MFWLNKAKIYYYKPSWGYALIKQGYGIPLLVIMGSCSGLRKQQQKTVQPSWSYSLMKQIKKYTPVRLDEAMLWLNKAKTHSYQPWWIAISLCLDKFGSFGQRDYQRSAWQSALHCLLIHTYCISYIVRGFLIKCRRCRDVGKVAVRRCVGELGESPSQSFGPLLLFLGCHGRDTVREGKGVFVLCDWPRTPPGQ